MSCCRMKLWRLSAVCLSHKQQKFPFHLFERKLALTDKNKPSSLLLFAAASQITVELQKGVSELRECWTLHLNGVLTARPPTASASCFMLQLQRSRLASPSRSLRQSAFALMSDFPLFVHVKYSACQLVSSLSLNQRRLDPPQLRLNVSMWWCSRLPSLVPMFDIQILNNAAQPLFH